MFEWDLGKNPPLHSENAGLWGMLSWESKGYLGQFKCDKTSWILLSEIQQQQQKD